MRTQDLYWRCAHKPMRIVVASDHAGLAHKALVIAALVHGGHHVVDYGTMSTEPVDYPCLIRPAALAVGRGEFDRGVVIGGSGNGEAIVANRVPRVRCALCWSVESARMARAHNDANMLSLGQRLVPAELALAILEAWLTTPFDGGRHARRVAEIDDPWRCRRVSQRMRGGRAIHCTSGDSPIPAAEGMSPLYDQECSTETFHHSSPTVMAIPTPKNVVSSSARGATSRDAGRSRRRQ